MQQYQEELLEIPSGSYFETSLEISREILTEIPRATPVEIQEETPREIPRDTLEEPE